MQAFPPLRIDECNFRGEVTEKFCAAELCDLMSTLICRVAAKLSLTFTFSLLPLGGMAAPTFRACIEKCEEKAYHRALRDHREKPYCLRG